MTDLSLEDDGGQEDGFFPKTPDLRRRGGSSLGLGSRELPHHHQATPSRKSTGNLRHKFRPRDNIAIRYKGDKRKQSISPIKGLIRSLPEKENEMEPPLQETQY